MDGKKLISNIRGSMSQLVWINAGDMVIFDLIDFGDNMKAEIITKNFD